jgi:RNA polymerase sigma-70 factor, ECF subfamily
MADPQAFEELVTRYQGVVCAVAYAVLRDRARSEEVAQEAFLIAWQKLPAMTPGRGWAESP